MWWLRTVYNKGLWKATGQENVNLEIRKRKFGRIGYTLRKDDGEIPKASLQGTHREAGREEDQK
jgi:hypothetical protein